jgi:hypothetical protein
MPPLAASCTGCRCRYYWYCGGAVIHWDCRNSPAAHAHPHTEALARLLNKSRIHVSRRACHEQHYAARKRGPPGGWFRTNGSIDALARAEVERSDFVWPK